jgi:hypothetical protein
MVEPMLRGDDCDTGKFVAMDAEGLVFAVLVDGAAATIVEELVDVMATEEVIAGAVMEISGAKMAAGSGAEEILKESETEVEGLWPSLTLRIFESSAAYASKTFELGV